MLTMEVAPRSSSAPSTPTRSSSGDDKRSQSSIDSFASRSRKVQFPSDEEIVTKYFDAPDPWSYLAPHQLTTQSLIEAYLIACDNQGTKPLTKVLNQLQRLHGFTDREEDLYLKGEKLDAKSCEALEEIFKRIRFRSINLESCNLDEEGSSALFDMIEYYESATHLNLANNKSIGMRGWQACCRMLKKTPCLQYLDLRNCGLSEQVLLILGRALRIGSHLISLRLERSGISSRALAILVAALKLNTSLEHLYLGDNRLCSGDAIQIANLLRANSTLDLLDLRDNDLQDEGLEHISEALRSQPSGPGEGLKYLIVSNNQMTSRGMNSLVEALPYCRSLRTINLNDNSLGDEGVIKLKEGIITAPRINALGLKNCKLNCQGAIAIADCFMESDNLHRVDLRENNIAEHGLMALYLAAQSNANILRIDLTNFDLSPDPNDPSATDCSSLINSIGLACEANQKLQQKDETLILNDQGLESPGAKIELFPAVNLTESTIPCTESVELRNSFYHSNLHHNNNNNNHGDQDSDCSDEFSLHHHSHCSQPKVTLPCPRKPILRSSSLGSWDSKIASAPLAKVTGNNNNSNKITITPMDNNNKEPVRRSGRFSVSPVPDSDSPPPPASSSASMSCSTSTFASFTGRSPCPSPLLCSSTYSPEPDQRLQQPSPTICNIPTPSPTVSPLQNEYNSGASGNLDSIDSNNNVVNSCFSGSSNSGAGLDTSCGSGIKVEKPKKRISFALPPEETIVLPGSSESFNKLRNRRMSSPAVPNNSSALSSHSSRPKIPSLKMYKILDGLDLKSSVPLSPTRLYQSLEFPDLISWKLPDEKDESVLV